MIISMYAVPFCRSQPEDGTRPQHILELFLCCESRQQFLSTPMIFINTVLARRTLQCSDFLGRPFTRRIGIGRTSPGFSSRRLSPTPVNCWIKFEPPMIDLTLDGSVTAVARKVSRVLSMVRSWVLQLNVSKCELIAYSGLLVRSYTFPNRCNFEWHWTKEFFSS